MIGFGGALLKRKFLNITMVILLLVLMAYHHTDERLHEYLGIIMGICLIEHNVINKLWYKSILKKQTFFQTMMTIINSLLIIDVIFLIVSGLMMSKIIPLYTIFNQALYARKIHLFCSYWGFVLMSMHIGMHLNGIGSKVKKKFEKSTALIKNIVFIIIPVFIAIVGIVMIFKHQLMTYLFMLNEFVFIDNQMTFIQFCIESIFIMLFIMEMTYLIRKYLKKRK